MKFAHHSVPCEPSQVLSSLSSCTKEEISPLLSQDKKCQRSTDIVEVYKLLSNYHSGPKITLISVKDLIAILILKGHQF